MSDEDRVGGDIEPRPLELYSPQTEVVIVGLCLSLTPPAAEQAQPAARMPDDAARGLTAEEGEKAKAAAKLLAAAAPELLAALAPVLREGVACTGSTHPGGVDVALDHHEFTAICVAIMKATGEEVTP